MHEQEKRIQTQRLREATKKGLTGLDGKFGSILKHLGDPIIAQQSLYYDSTYLPDVYQVAGDEENDLPIFDEEAITTEIGQIYSGLRNGINLEIKYVHTDSELVVTHNGHVVYQEITGELTCYVPGDDWERKVDELYTIAKKKESDARKREVVQNKQESQRQKASLLHYLKTKWGV